jgi:hypothetical protein
MKVSNTSRKRIKNAVSKALTKEFVRNTPLKMWRKADKRIWNMLDAIITNACKEIDKKLLKFQFCCLIYIENEATRNELIEWLRANGYKNHYDLPRDFSRGYIHTTGDREYWPPKDTIPDGNWTVNCGTDIELFKALLGLNSQAFDETENDNLPF